MDDEKKGSEGGNPQSPENHHGNGAPRFYNGDHSSQEPDSINNAQRAKEEGQEAVLSRSKPELLADAERAILAGLSRDEPKMIEEALCGYWPAELNANACGPITSSLHRRGRIVPDGYGYGKSKRSKRSLVVRWRLAQ